MRIIFDIDRSDAEALDALAFRERTSRAAQLRIAVRVHLAQQAGSALYRSFAQWPEAPDGLGEMLRLRELEAE